jgi:hypothetical protein
LLMVALALVLGVVACAVTILTLFAWSGAGL